MHLKWDSKSTIFLRIITVYNGIKGKFVTLKSLVSDSWPKAPVEVPHWIGEEVTPGELR
jgi:hypothetical protein